MEGKPSIIKPLLDVHGKEYGEPVSFLKDETFINWPLRFWRFPPQTQMLQCVMKMFVNLLCFFTGLKIWKIFSNLLDKLVQNLNCDLQENMYSYIIKHVAYKKYNSIKMF